MKIRGQAEKWLRVGLGVACLLLIAHLLMQFGGVRTGGSRAVPAAAAAGRTRPADSMDDLVRYDPVVRLDLLKKFQARPLPQLARNPFEAEAPKPVAPPVTAPAPPPPPPAPPPIPLKSLGYSERNGRQEAFVSDDDQTYVVHEGETFAQRYRVLKITPKFVEISDETTHQTAQLPFAQ